MKRYGLIALALMFVVTLAAQPEGAVKMMKDKKREMMANSTMSVENTAGGVVVTVSSDDAETIAALQQFWSQRAEQWNEKGKPKGPKKEKGKISPKRRSKDENAPEPKTGKK